MNEPFIMLLTLLAAVLLGVPIPISIAIATIVGYFLIDIPFVALAQAMYAGADAFALLTIPLFVFAGSLMERGGLALRIVTIARLMVGNYTGSLAIVSIVGCTFFAALSGSGPATTAAIGTIMIPAMARDRYDPAFGGAVVASGGALGSLIPPSILMIVYGIVSETSIPRLFMAGIIPGLLASVLLMLAAWLVSKKRGYGGGDRVFSWGEFVHAVWDGKWAIIAPVLILGGIYSGIFTPTEAAAVAVFYAFIVGAFVYRELTVASVIDCLKVTGLLLGTVLIMIGPAKAFGELMSLLDVPNQIGQFLTGYTTNAFTLLMVMALIVIITGTIIETIPQIILLTPLMLPIAIRVGIDPIVFGIVMIVTCEVGFLTPPVGANLFVATRLTGQSIDRISIAVIPFLIAYVLVVVVIGIFPTIVTFLPDLAYGVSR